MNSKCAQVRFYNIIILPRYVIYYYTYLQYTVILSPVTDAICAIMYLYNTVAAIVENWLMLNIQIHL